MECFLRQVLAETLAFERAGACRRNANRTRATRSGASDVHHGPAICMLVCRANTKAVLWVREGEREREDASRKRKEVNKTDRQGLCFSLQTTVPFHRWSYCAQGRGGCSSSSGVSQRVSSSFHGCTAAHKRTGINAGPSRGAAGAGLSPLSFQSCGRTDVGF